MSNELKPCECGSTDISIGYESQQAYWVECGDCGTATEEHSTREAAVADWNRQAQPAEAEGVSALDDLLALFPLKIDKQAFVVNGGAPLTADGDDEFLSFKKVDAALGEIRRLAEQGRAALSAVTAERDRLRAAISDPETVFVNMKAGTIAKPTLRSMIDLYGEVVNGDEAQLLEIARLRAEVEALRTKIGDPELFTCIGKGGVYEKVASALGAGSLRGQHFMVYRSETDYFVREYEDFQDRMEPTDAAMAAKEGV